MRLSTIPGKKRPGNSPDPESTPGKRQRPALAESTNPEDAPAPEQRRPEEQASSEIVTNQDEQDKVTNAGDSETPVAEN